MNGQSQVLANWFTQPTDASGPLQDFIREEILEEIANRPLCYAVENEEVFVETENGRAAMRCAKIKGSEVVIIDYATKGKWGLVNFWMNASSMSFVSDALRKNAMRIESVDAIFMGADTAMVAMVDEDGPAPWEIERVSSCGQGADFELNERGRYCECGEPLTSDGKCWECDLNPPH